MLRPVGVFLARLSSSRLCTILMDRHGMERVDRNIDGVWHGLEEERCAIVNSWKDDDTLPDPTVKTICSVGVSWPGHVYP
jgi:hypothetical protein